MALKREALQKIAALLKISEAEIETAIKGEAEIDITIPEVTVFTKDELDQRDTNQKNDGIKIGKEIGVKEVRKAAGIDEGGSKDPAKAAQQISEKALAEAKMKPDEKVIELSKQIDTLKTTLSAKEQEIESANQKVSGVLLDRTIFSSLPKERADVLTDDEYISAIKSNFSINNIDGNLVISRGGKELRDPKTAMPVDLGTAVKDYFGERKGWMNGEQQQQGGRGAGDSGTRGAFTKKSQVIDHYEKQGININGSEGSQKIASELAKIAKENPDFDMNG